MPVTDPASSRIRLTPAGRRLLTAALALLGAIAVTAAVWIFTRTVTAPESAFGQGAGRNVEIAPGVVAKSFTAPVNGTGSIVIDGPGPVDIEGTYTFQDSANWRIDVTGGSGTVGGGALSGQDFTGNISRASGEVTTDVNVEIPGAHRQHVQGWDHTHALHIGYAPAEGGTGQASAGLFGAGGGAVLAAGPLASGSTHAFTGTVTISAIKGASTLTGSGQMADDGSYEADWTGKLYIGEYPVDLSGHYESVGWQGATSEVWNAAGTLEKLTFTDGSTVDSGTISATSTSPTFTGSAEITYSMSAPMVVDYTVSYSDANTWAFTAAGTQTADWKPTTAPGLTVKGTSFTGSFASAPGATGAAVLTYGVRATSSLLIDGITFTGSLKLTGPNTWSASFTAGSGQVLGSNSGIKLGSVSGSISYASGAINGSLVATTAARTTVVLPSGWVHSTTLSITYAKTSSASAASATVNASYTGTGSTGDTISLVGTYATPGTYALTATGTLSVNGGSVALAGQYYSRGYVVSGSALTAPDWSLTGTLTGVKLGSGSTVTSGSVSLTSATPGFVGSAVVQPFGDSFSFDTSFAYTTSRDWTLKVTAGSSATKIWSPSSFPNLSIGASTLTGKVAMTSGTLAWSIVAPGVTWKNIATGVTMVSDFSIGTSCPLSANCPSTTGMFVGFTNGSLSFNTPSLKLTTSGALLSDGSWGRFDAAAGTLSFNGISVTGSQLTMWKGSRSDSPVAGLGMPDLSASNNGWGVEFCGTFNIGIPDLPTLSTGGCIEWTPDGVVMGQVAMSGSLSSPTSSGGITIGNTTISGFGWTDLTSKPKVTLNGIATTLAANTNTISGSMAIPGTVMKAITGSAKPATLPGSGWFSATGFSFNAGIAVNLKGQGFDVDEIFFDIGKNGRSFTLDFGADGDVTIQGTSWPVTAELGFATGSQTEVSLTLMAKGTRSAIPAGSFDSPSLLPSGTFEPEGVVTTIDGSFDRPASSTLAHGDFENAVAPGELLSNGDFENGYGQNYAVNGDIENAAYGNIAFNADFEETNMAINGDFEASTYNSNWTTQTGSSVTSISDVGPGPADGTKVMRISNTGSSSSTQTGTGHGIMQRQTYTVVAGVTYTVGAWVRTGSGTAPQAQLSIQADTSASPCTGTQVSSSSTPISTTSTWTYVAISITPQSCQTNLVIWISSVNGGTAIDVDNVVLYATQPATPVLFDIANTNDWVASDSKIATAIHNYPPSARSGSGYMDITTQSGSASSYIKLQTTITPNVGDVFTFSGWAYAPSGSPSITPTLYTAGGTAESSFKAFPVGAGWTPFVVTLQIAHSGHTDLYLSLGVSVSSITVRVDDLQLSQSQFLGSPSAANSAGVVHRFNPDVAHSGSGYLELHHQASSGQVSAYSSLAPQTSLNGGLNGWGIGGTWTAGMWVRTLSGTANVTLWLHTSGSGMTDTATADASIGTSWQYLTVPLTLTQSGATALTYELISSTPGSIIYIDDVSLGVTSVDYVPSASDAWTAGSSTQINNFFSTGAKSGGAYLNMWPTNGAGVRPAVSRAITLTPLVGQKYTATAWVRSVNGTYNFTLSAGSNTASTSVTLTTGQWTPISVQLPITASGATSMQVAFSAVNLNQASLDIDDVSVTVTGLVQPAPWAAVSASGGATQYAVLANSAVAHGGDNYLEFSTVGAGGGVSQTVAGAVTAGTAQTASLWVKSGTSSSYACTVTLRFLSSGGSTVNERSVTFTASSTWTEINLTGVAGTGVASTVLLVQANSAGATVDLDDVTITPTAPWAPTATGTTTLWTTVDRSEAKDGQGYLTMTGSAQGSGITATATSAVTGGGSYRMTAWVRTSAGAAAESGSFTVTTSGANTSETFTKTFTSKADWTAVVLEFSPKNSNTTLTESITLNSSGSLDVDSISVIATVIVQSDPWLVTSDSASAPIAATVLDDSSAAHTGSGYLQAVSGSGSGEVSHAVSVAPANGSTYVATVVMKSVSGTAGQGQICLIFTGGATERQCTTQTVSATDWTSLSVSLTSASSGHTGITVQLGIPAGQRLAIDDAGLVPGDWQPITPTTGTVTQTQYSGDGAAQSGPGYLVLYRSSGSGDAGTQLVVPGAVSNGSTQAMSVWLRSVDGSAVSGRIALTASGGGAKVTASESFTVVSGWQEVTLTLPITTSGLTSLTAAVYLDTPGEYLAVDSVDVDPNAGAEPDGITDTLSNPQTGYTYLWDDAWGIPGAHLWAVTGQVSFTNGKPGIGLGATTYYDPTAVPSVMDGTAWVKGQLVANISSADPCFAFGFDAGSSGTKISIDGGLFTSTQFQLSIAPRGCSVGDYALAPGSSLSFSAGLGTATINFDLAVGRDDDGLPTFYESVAIDNLKLAGITYNTITLITDITAESTDVTFEGQMSLATGTFAVNYDMSAGPNGIHIGVPEGQEYNVAVTNWTVKGGSNGAFDVSYFYFAQEMDIPFGANACANFSAETSGNMKLGSRHYDFTGDIGVQCGVLKTLDFDFLYWHGGISYNAYLHYDSSTMTLAGGYTFDFGRRISWMYLSHRYVRHPHFTIWLSFNLEFANPSRSSLTLGGRVSVSGGDGDVTCTIYGDGQDDYCHLHAHISAGGGKTWNDTW